MYVTKRINKVFIIIIIIIIITKYKELIEEQKKKIPSVIFINLSISALSVFDKESAAFINMLESMHLDKSHVKYIIKKINTYSVVETKNGQIQT